MKLETRTVTLHPTVVESIKDHAKRECDKGGYEAVGFVAKNKNKEIGVATLPLNNHAPDPQHGFFVEPWEQFRAETWLEEEGYEILGVYHSHPNSEALPSQMDHKLARPGECVFIYSVVFGDLKAYAETDGALEPVELIT